MSVSPLGVMCHNNIYGRICSAKNDEGYNYAAKIGCNWSDIYSPLSYNTIAFSYNEDSRMLTFTCTDTTESHGLYPFVSKFTPWYGLRDAVSSIKFGEGISAIGDNNFTDFSASSVSFPSTLKYIVSYAFAGCENLSTIDFNDGLEEIYSCAFADVNKNSMFFRVEIPASVTTIGSYSLGYEYDKSSGEYKKDFSVWILSATRAPRLKPTPKVTASPS